MIPRLPVLPTLDPLPLNSSSSSSCTSTNNTTTCSTTPASQTTTPDRKKPWFACKRRTDTPDRDRKQCIFAKIKGSFKKHSHQNNQQLPSLTVSTTPTTSCTETSSSTPSPSPSPSPSQSISRASTPSTAASQIPLQHTRAATSGVAVALSTLYAMEDPIISHHPRQLYGMSSSSMTAVHTPSHISSHQRRSIPSNESSAISVAYSATALSHLSRQSSSSSSHSHEHLASSSHQSQSSHSHEYSHSSSPPTTSHTHPVRWHNESRLHELQKKMFGCNVLMFKFWDFLPISDLCYLSSVARSWCCFLNPYSPCAAAVCPQELLHHSSSSTPRQTITSHEEHHPTLPALACQPTSSAEAPSFPHLAVYPAISPVDARDRADSSSVLLPTTLTPLYGRLCYYYHVQSASFRVFPSSSRTQHALLRCLSQVHSLAFHEQARYNIYDYTMIYIQAFCPHLHTLILSKCPRITHHCMGSIMKSGPKLHSSVAAPYVPLSTTSSTSTSTSTSHPTNTTSHPPAFPSTAATPSLRCLDISGCIGISDPCLGFIRQRYLTPCHGITAVFSSLNLESCVGITDHGLMLLGTPMKVPQFHEDPMDREGDIDMASQHGGIDKDNDMSDDTTSSTTTSLITSPLQHLNLSRCPNIRGTGLYTIFCTHDALRSLILFDMPQLEDDALAYIGRCHTLIELNISHCTRLTDRSIAYIAQCTTLEILDISYDTNMTDMAIAHLATSCHALKHLSMRSLSQLTDKSFHMLSMGCPKLSELIISFCRGLTDCGLHALSSLPLHHLELWSCTGFTDRGISFLASRTSRDTLTFLNIDGCYQLTSSGLSTLLSCPHLTAVRNLCGASVSPDIISSWHQQRPDLKFCFQLTGVPR